MADDVISGCLVRARYLSRRFENLYSPYMVVKYNKIAMEQKQKKKDNGNAMSIQV